MADCDLCGGGFRARRTWAGGGGRRWIRGVTGGDNLITAFYLLSSSSSRLAGSLASPSPTSCRYGNLKPGKKPGVVAGGGGDLMAGAEMDARRECVCESRPRRRETRDGEAREVF